MKHTRKRLNRRRRRTNRNKRNRQNTRKGGSRIFYKPIDEAPILKNFMTYFSSLQTESEKVAAIPELCEHVLKSKYALTQPRFHAILLQKLNEFTTIPYLPAKTRELLEYTIDYVQSVEPILSE